MCPQADPRARVTAGSNGSDSPRHPIWSIHNEWSVHYFVVFTVLVLASLCWVALDTRSLTGTLERAGSCVVASAALGLIIIEGGGRTMVSAAERWRRLRQAPAKERAEGRAEGLDEGLAVADSEWAAWVERKEAAERTGAEFTEPPPSSRRNGGA